MIPVGAHDSGEAETGAQAVPETGPPGRRSALGGLGARFPSCASGVDSLVQSMTDVLRRSLRAGACAGLGMMLLTAPVLAQDMPAPPPQDIPDEVQELMQEFQEMQERFMQLQNQVLQMNPELQQRQAAIGEMVNEAMAELNPDAVQQMDRLAELEQEAALAQQEQDMEELQELINEAQGLQAQLQSVQAQALEQEHVQEEIDSFQDELLEEMMEVDPEAGAILERLDELATQLGAEGPPEP